MVSDTEILDDDSTTASRSGFMRLLDRLRRALVAAVEDEAVRKDSTLATATDECVISDLPDPPHLEPGDLKFGNGMHDYF